MWEAIAAIAAVVGALVTAGGLYFVARQIKVGRESIRAQFINELSKEAASMYDTYTKLLPGEAWSSAEAGPQSLEERAKLIAYLGFFAKIKYLIEIKAIDLKTVDRMFAFRFFLIAHNRHVQEQILYSTLYEGFWAGIFGLHYEWTKFRIAQNEKIPWSENSLESYDQDRYLLAIQNQGRKGLIVR
jgi:hypothetical protein